MDFERFKKINDDRLNYKELENASIISSYRNVGCGDGYRIYLKIDPTTKIINDASYTTTGCGFGITALAMVVEWVKGKSIDEAINVQASDIESLFEFPPLRKNYPESSAEAMRKAIADYINGTGIKLDEYISRGKILAILEEKGHLRDLVLKQAVLEKDNFSGVDFSNTNLSNAFLQSANLENANLQNVNLRGAFLNNANLKNANLQGADLRWCKLTGANIEGANFTDALYDIGTRIDSNHIHLFKAMKQMGKELYSNVD